MFYITNLHQFTSLCWGHVCAALINGNTHGRSPSFDLESKTKEDSSLAACFFLLPPIYSLTSRNKGNNSFHSCRQTMHHAISEAKWRCNYWQADQSSSRTCVRRQLIKLQGCDVDATWTVLRFLVISIFEGWIRNWKIASWIDLGAPRCFHLRGCFGAKVESSQVHFPDGQTQEGLVHSCLLSDETLCSSWTKSLLNFRFKSEIETLAWDNKGLVLPCGNGLQEGLLHRVSKNPAERLDGNWTRFPKVASAQLSRLIPNSDIVLWTGPVTSTKAGC